MSNPYTVGVDTSTLPNEPLKIVITEAASECLLLRALLRQAIHSLLCGSEAQRDELAEQIALLLVSR